MAQAQTLTISGTGETGTSGNNWSIASGTLTVTGNATVDVTVIEAEANLTIVGSNAGLNVTIDGPISPAAPGVLVLGTPSSRLGSVTVNAAISNVDLEIRAQSLVGSTEIAIGAGREVLLDLTGTSSFNGWITILSGATLVLEQDSDFTLAANLRGPGTLIKRGAGVATLTGTSAVASTDGRTGGTTTVEAGTLVFQNNEDPSTSFAHTFDGSGVLRFEPSSDRWSSTFHIRQNVDFGNDLTGLIIGKPGQIRQINIDPRFQAPPIEIAGPITIYGSLNASRPLIARNNTIRIVNGTVAATQSADGWFEANRLELSGASTFTFGSSMNKVDTLALGFGTDVNAGERANNPIFVNSKSLVLDNVFAWVSIQVRTTDGDITISGDIDIGSQSTSTESLLLAAGRTTRNGNVVISGTPSVNLSVGSGRIFSGSADDSPGLSALVDKEFVVADSASWVNWVNNRNVVPSGITLAMLEAPGLNAIYREESAPPLPGHTLTISASGETGTTSGTNWSYASNTLTISGNANIRASVIVDLLTAVSAGGTLMVQSPAGTPLSLVVSEAIDASTLNKSLRIGAAGNDGVVVVNAPISLGRQFVLVADQFTGTGTITTGLVGTDPFRSSVGADLTLGANSVFDGVISAAADARLPGLVKRGPGVLTLTEDQTYVGGTTILEGGVRIGNGGTSGSLGVGADPEAQVSISLGATLTFDRSDDFTVPQRLSGAGNVVKLGTNTLTSTGIPALSGIMTIDGGTLVLQNDELPDARGVVRFEGTGALRIEPATLAFRLSDFGGTNWSFAPTLSSVTVGKPNMTSWVRIFTPITIDGPVTIHGGEIQFTQAVTSQTSDVRVFAYGPATRSCTFAAGASQSASVCLGRGLFAPDGDVEIHVLDAQGVARQQGGDTRRIATPNLRLLGLGRFVLDNDFNAVTTLVAGESATKPAGVHFRNLGDLTIGAVGSQTGITSAGPVKIETFTGNLTLAANISTDDATADAVILNAGQSKAIRDTTGGDILISGTPTITMGSGGIGKLFSGSEENSTGLTAFVGGTANEREGGDETSAAFNPALQADNLYAIYRFLDVLVEVEIANAASNNQSARVGTAVTTPPSVVVKEETVVVGAGVDVTFTVASGGGTVGGQSSVTVQTNASGIATAPSWVLGNTAGTNTLTVTSPGVSSPVTFTATGTPAPASKVEVDAGSAQTATAGAAVATPPSVVVRDLFDNPVPGVTVTFAVTAGGGSVSAPSAITDASGVATVTWTLGTTAGTNTLTATIPGTAPITFTATGEAGPAAAVVPALGNNQAADGGTAVATPPSIRVVDANDNPVSGVTVTFTVASGGGTINPASPATVTTGTDGVAALTSWTLGNTPGANTITVTSTGLDPITLTAISVDPAARDAILDFSQGMNTTAPTTVDTYTNAGITGADADNLAAYNDALSRIEATDIADVQAMVDAFNAILDAASSSDASGLVASDFEAVGVEFTLLSTDPLLADAVDLLNNGVASSDPAGVDTVDELQAIADTAEEFVSFATTGDADLAPTPQNYQTLGFVVINDNVPSYNSSVAETEARTTEPVQAIIDAYDRVLDGATLTRDEYTDLGVTVDPSSVFLLNYGVLNADRADLETVEDLQALADAADLLSAYAGDNPGADTPDAADYEALGFDVNDDNISAYNSVLRKTNPNTVQKIEDIIAAYDKLLDGEDLTLQEFAALGVPVRPEALALVNDATKDPNLAIVPVDALQTLINAAERMLAVADGQAVTPPLGIADFSALGIGGVTPDNVEALVAALALLDPTQITTVEGLIAMLPFADPPSPPTITNVKPWENSLIVSFTAPEDDGGAPILNYEYSVDGGVTWVAVQPAVTSSPFRINGLVNGTSYPISIRALNMSAPGEPSEIEVQVPATPPAPAAPGVPTVVPGDAPGTLIITMPAVPAELPAGTEEPESYTVRASPSGKTCTITLPNTSCTLTGLIEGEPQTVTVFATNPGGNSPAITAPPAIAGAPVAPAAPMVEVLEGAARVTVTPPPAGGTPTSYTVTANPGGASCTIVSPETSCVITGLTNGTAYTFTVTATNARGTSTSSAATEPAVPFVKPEAPATIEVEAGPGSLIVRWGTPPAKAGAEVVGYSVESQQTGTTDWQAIEPLDAEAREAVIEDLDPEASYRVRVAAITEFGIGEWAEPTSLAVPLTTVPALRVETTLSNPRPALGDTVTVQIRVTSSGGVAAENIELKLTPDAPRLQVLSWQASAGVVDAATLIWRIDSLAAGSEVIVELEAVVIEGADEAPAGASEGAPVGAAPEASAAGDAR